MNSEQTLRYYQENATARLTVLLIVCVSAFLTPLSLSATLVAIPAIAHDLHADAVHASWIPAVFLLSNMIAMLPCGRLADIHGRKRIFILGSIIFVFGTLLAAFASHILFLLVCRAIQGVGAGMFFSTGMAIVSSVYQNNGRGAALGWVVSSVYVGLTCGPLIGGVITDHFGWHAVFYFQVPLALMGAWLAPLKMKGEWKSSNPARLDWTGTALLAIWVLALYAGTSTFPDPLSGVWFLVGLGFLYQFVRHCNTSPNPLVKLKVVRENRVFSGALSASVLMYGSNYGLIFLLGLYFQYNRGMTPTEAGQLLMLQAMVMAVLAPLSGRLSDRYSAHYLASMGCLAMVSGLGLLLLFLRQDTSYYLIGAALMLMGVGFGMFSTPNNSGALGSVPEERLGIASALLSMSRLMGQMLGTAVSTLLLSVYIGGKRILPEHYDALLSVVQGSLAVSVLFAIGAAYYSLVQRPVTPA